MVIFKTLILWLMGFVCLQIDFCDCALWHEKSYFPHQGLNPRTHAPTLEAGVLTTGLRGKSLVADVQELEAIT